MDRHRRQRIERAAACPRCPAKANERCNTVDGMPHASRVAEYELLRPRGGSDAARTVPVALGDAMPQYRALDDADKARVREAGAVAMRVEMGQIRHGRRG